MSDSNLQEWLDQAKAQFQQPEEIVSTKQILTDVLRKWHEAHETLRVVYEMSIQMGIDSEAQLVSEDFYQLYNRLMVEYGKECWNEQHPS